MKVDDDTLLKTTNLQKLKTLLHQLVNKTTPIYAGG